MGVSLMMLARPSRSRENDYARGYADAVSAMHHPWGDPEEDMEMRRRRRSHHDMPWGDPEEDMEMRRRRMHHPWGDPEEDMEMRRRRGHMPDWMDKPRQIGFTAKATPLDPALESVLENAEHVMQSPPETWAPYKRQKDFKGIVKMEVQELVKALEQGKSAKDIKKELTHTVAALMQLTLDA